MRFPEEARGSDAIANAGSEHSPAGTAMGPGAEFDTIRALVGRWGPLARDIGDDAALLHAPVGRTLVASTDAFVEDAHFREGWLSSEEIGARATAAALSDLAAMGARAEAILVAFTVPDAWRSRLLDVADGIAWTLGRAGGRIVGGNISKGATFGITTTAIGSAARVVRRSGALVGDRVLVTGMLGGPGRAIARWRDGARPDAWSRQRFARPVPRLAAGELFAASGVHAMLDISDGLVADARHLAAASNVQVRLDAARIPRGPGISIEQALASGEEYELLLTCATDLAGMLIAGAAEQGSVAVTDIGEVVAAEPGVAYGTSARMSDSDSPASRPRAGVIVLGAPSSAVVFTGGHDHFSS